MNEMGNKVECGSGRATILFEVRKDVGGAIIRAVRDLNKGGRDSCFIAPFAT